jgi:heat shock protein 1/8
MKAGEPVLEVVFEVDVNGILKVTATEKTSGRSANITISNSVGKLSSTEIENMINGKHDPLPDSVLEKQFH